MLKLSFEKKVCSMIKIFSLSFIHGYELIYKQIDGVKPELPLLFSLKLGVLEV